jgi:hypothetical protein
MRAHPKISKSKRVGHGSSDRVVAYEARGPSSSRRGQGKGWYRMEREEKIHLEHLLKTEEFIWNCFI